MLEYLEGKLLQIEAYGKVQDYRKDHPPAVDQGKTECCRSGLCCFRRPGSLDQADVTTLAAHLGLTEQALFQQYLLVDYIDGEQTIVLRRRSQPGGRMLSWRESFDYSSACVFLTDENACQIHDAKPAICKAYKCWDESTESLEASAWTDEELKALGWDGVDPSCNSGD